MRQNKNRKMASQEPIIWQGDLADDCTALWAGLMLRAEWMSGNDWWWAVYDDMQENDMEVDSSNEHDGIWSSGEAARAEAEIAARKYLVKMERL